MISGDVSGQLTGHRIEPKAAVRLRQPPGRQVQAAGQQHVSTLDAARAGLDYSASAICAFAGFAALPPGALDHCDASIRSPFDGRA